MSNSTPTPDGFPRPTPPSVTPEQAEAREPLLEQLPHGDLYQRVIRSLDVGQVVSAVLILLALVLIVIDGDDLPRETVAFTNLLDPVLKLDGDAMLSLGILALILTPLIYVGSALYTFIRERDGLFVTVTLVLLGILSASVIVASI